MGKINVLSFEVANLIAAGEVVDRPASCVKELVENSIDSGATRITVEIQHGGILYMRVTDNGCGISPEDLPVAVRRHATSKIKDASDLAAIMTLGFRGEALAAISAVSDVRIVSRTADAEYGSSIEVNSGRVGAVTERGASVGTTVIVENLFANVPARLKFLKRDQTEAMAVCSAVEKIAMSHPEIAFRTISDGVCKLETPGDGRLASAVRAVYGREFASKLIAADAAAGGVRAWGYITSPEAPRANRNYQNFFINGRYVRTRTGSAAIEQAYTSYIPQEKFPGCVINLEIQPSAVDVNVHPSKLEVKFSDERPVFDAVYHAVRDALLSNTARPEIGADASEDAAESGIQPQGPQLMRPGDVTAGQYAPRPQQQLPKPHVSSAFAPVDDRAERGRYRPEQMSIGDAVTTASGITVDFGRAPETRVNAGTGGPDTKEAITRETAGIAQNRPENAPQAVNEADSSAKAPVSGVPPVKAWRIVGELFNSYVITEEGDTVTLIDKHAAHERIIFEKLRRNLKTQKRATQLLALPVDVILMSDEAAIIAQNRESIEAAGFGFSVSRNKISVNELPADIDISAVPAMFETFASVLRDGDGSVELTEMTLFEKALYRASCKAAVKAGRVYPEGYAEWLVAEMHRIPEATYCPHGRPVAFVFRKGEFDRMFKRT